MRLFRRILFSVFGYIALFILFLEILTSKFPEMSALLWLIVVFVLPAVIVRCVYVFVNKRQTLMPQAHDLTMTNAPSSETLSVDSSDINDDVDILAERREEELDAREVAIKEKEEALKTWYDAATAEIEAEKQELAREIEHKNQQLKKIKSERSAYEHTAYTIQQYRIALEKTEQRVLSWVKLREAEEMEYFNGIRADVERFEKYAEITPNMDGFKFEEYVAKVLADNGYSEVSVTQKSRDFGADITAVFGGARYVFQCKYYTSPVGINAVQEVYASKPVYSAHVAVVITNSVFTKAAKILADEVGVILWDGEKLAAMNVQEKPE